MQIIKIFIFTIKFPITVENGKKHIKSVNKLEKFKISDFSNLMLLFRSKLYKCLFQLYNNVIFWACSSVVERYVDIVEVISSILITPTKNRELHKH